MKKETETSPNTESDLTPVEIIVILSVIGLALVGALFIAYHAIIGIYSHFEQIKNLRVQVSDMKWDIELQGRDIRCLKDKDCEFINYGGQELIMY